MSLSVSLVSSSFVFLRGLGVYSFFLRSFICANSIKHFTLLVPVFNISDFPVFYSSEILFPLLSPPVFHLPFSPLRHSSIPLLPSSLASYLHLPSFFPICLSVPCLPRFLVLALILPFPRHPLSVPPFLALIISLCPNPHSPPLTSIQPCPRSSSLTDPTFTKPTHRSPIRQPPLHQM